jgi:acylphosphatase
MPTVHLLIQGKVQGVYYRASAREEALRLGLTGWVRNTKEGHVEVVVTGTAGSLEQFSAWCRQGPPSARVTACDISSLPEEYFADFRILR